MMTVIAVWGDHPGAFSPGSRWPLDGPSMSAEVFRTGRPVRVEDYTDLPGSLAGAAREGGFRQGRRCPDHRRRPGLGSDRDALPRTRRFRTTSRILSPSSPSSWRPRSRTARRTTDLTRLAEEQAALRRVATLVARGAPPAELFEAVMRRGRSAGRRRGCRSRSVRARRDGHGARRLEQVPATTTWGRATPLEGTVSGLILETRGPPADRSYAGEPGSARSRRPRAWLALVGGGADHRRGRPLGCRWWSCRRATEPLPPDTERRLVEFTELVATAIANAASREELTMLAEEQAALRRVATLVAPRAHGRMRSLRPSGTRSRERSVSPSPRSLRFDPDGIADRSCIYRRGTRSRSRARACGSVARVSLPRSSGRGAQSGSTIDRRLPTRRSASSPARRAYARPSACRSSSRGAVGVMNAGSTELLPQETEGRLAKFTQLLGDSDRERREPRRARSLARADRRHRRRDAAADRARPARRRSAAARLARARDTRCAGGDAAGVPRASRRAGPRRSKV